MFWSLFSIFKKKKILKRPRRVWRDAEGAVFNLQQIYERLNEEYFESRLNLSITWSGHPGRVARYKRRLGSFDSETQLIKIHRLLDNTAVPIYFVRFVVYHEMLHHVCPPKRSRRGGRSIHHAAFKHREKQFCEYVLAQKWVKTNRHFFLEGTPNGRS